MFESFNLNNKKKDSGLEKPYDNGQNENLFENQEEEINLQGLESDSFEDIVRALELLQKIQELDDDLQNIFNQKREEFIQEVSRAYSDEELAKTALYQILLGNDISKDVENVDLEGDYSITSFLRDFLLENTE